MTIIMAHKGPACDYLGATLRCAVLASERHRVISISDQQIHLDGVENYSWDHYAEGTKWFEDLPRFAEEDVFHRCSFVRFAIMKNFCEDKGIDRFFSADSDVVITADLGAVCEQWNDCDFTMSVHPATRMGMVWFGGNKEMDIGHASHSVMTIGALTEYMEFCKEYAAIDGHIGCDMMAWSAFKERTTKKWANTFSVLDHHIGDGLDTYENDGQLKIITWRGADAFKTRKDNGAVEPMPIIHCWSWSKTFIRGWRGYIEQATGGKRR